MDEFVGLCPPSFFLVPASKAMHVRTLLIKQFRGQPARMFILL